MTMTAKRLLEVIVAFDVAKQESMFFQFMVTVTLSTNIQQG